MSYQPRTKPRKHQVEALRRIEKKPASPSSEDVFALLMEMGTGKSKVIVDEFGERASCGDLMDLLVIAPAGSYKNWIYDRGEEDPSELRKHLNPALYEAAVMCEWRSGGGGRDFKNRLAAMLRCVDPKRPRVLTINVEALSTVERAVDAAREFMSRGRTLMVIDESTRIKNPGSDRTEAVDELGGLAPARRILSGLVTPNSPLDLFSQFWFLDWRILGSRSYQTFKSRYAVTKQLQLSPATIAARKLRNKRAFAPRVVVNYRNVEELYDKIAPYSYRVLKEQCLDLPPKEYTIRDVELHPVQRRMYHEMQDFCIARLEQEPHVTASMVLTQRLRLDQILCGHTKDDDGVVRPVPEYRSKMLMEILADVQNKAIIWTSHDYCIRTISEMLRKKYGPKSVAQFWGGNRGTRHLDEARFKRDPECRWMLATPSAGGIGNTWTVAGTTIYYNNSDNLEHRLQSEDRTHRDGLKKEDGGAGRALYVDLVAQGTGDMKKLRALRKKLNIASLISGDGHRSWIV